MPIIGFVLLSLRSLVRSRGALHLEILAVRHQLQILERSRRRRVRLTGADRLLWVWLSRVWSEWRTALVLVQPDTVVAWHRHGLRLFWTWKSRHRTGRPTVPAEVGVLIRTMSQADPLWGAPRIHGELQKLGIAVSQSTVAKYMVSRRRPPSQTWRTFLANHVDQVMAADFFVVPTADAPSHVPGRCDRRFSISSAKTCAEWHGTSNHPTVLRRGLTFGGWLRSRPMT